MTDDKKPDGYVAWHPNWGLYYMSFGNSRVSCSNNLVAYWQNIKLEHADNRLEEYKANGWRIRPVKLIFLDEVEG